MLAHTILDTDCHLTYIVYQMAGDSLGQLGQLVLTAILSLSEDAYGVTIHEKVEHLAHPKAISLGAVYVTLDRAEDKGLISSWLSEPTQERGGRSKRCYRLEPLGQRALQESGITARRVSDVLVEVWGNHWERRWKRA
jgi:PadR family transcriptional regulator PadR